MQFVDVNLKKCRHWIIIFTIINSIKLNFRKYFIYLIRRCFVQPLTDSFHNIKSCFIRGKCFEICLHENVYDSRSFDCIHTICRAQYFNNSTINLWLSIIRGKCFEICNCQIETFDCIETSMICVLSAVFIRYAEHSVLTTVSWTGVKQIKSWRFAANFDEKKSYQNFSYVKYLVEKANLLS